MNVTMSRVRVTSTAVEKQYYIFWVCVYGLRYKACNAHAPYYIGICDLSGCIIFSHILS